MAVDIGSSRHDLSLLQVWAGAVIGSDLSYPQFAPRVKASISSF